MTKVAVVTGSNKGIGFAIVKGLYGKFDGDIFLTARSEERGLAAVDELKKDGVEVKFHQLDINNKESIEKLANFLKETYGGLDVLVNNAGVMFPDDCELPGAPEAFSFNRQRAKETIGTNYFCTKQTCDIIFPLLRDGARVVNVSSDSGYLGRIEGNDSNSVKLRAKLATSDSTLTVDELSKLMTDFIQATEAGNWKEIGWPDSAYLISKIGLCTLSRIQQREFNKDPRKDLVLNHVHPGYVNTDMTLNLGESTLEEGAKSSIFAALLPPGTDIKGQYIWKDCTIVDWVNGPLPSEY